MIFGASPYASIEYGGIVGASVSSGIVIKKTSGGVITDLTSYSLWNTLELLQVLTKEIGYLKFNIFNVPGTPLPIIGDQIDMYLASAHLFGGTVTDVESIVAGGILLSYQITATDWGFRANGKLVVKAYTNEDPADIVRDIISNFAPTGFTAYNVVTAGFNVTSIKFNYDQVTTAIEKIASQIGWEWYIDADKDLHFFPPNVEVDAPYVVDDTSGNLEWISLDIDQSIVNMKNSIYVIGGNYTKAFDATTTPDTYLTDGVKMVFSLAYPYVFASIVVTLNGVAQTVGTDQVTDPATVQVLYNEGSRFVRFTAVPTTGQTVKIYGVAQIPILAHVSNEPAIAAFGEIQGSVIDPQISSIDEAQARGLAQIEDYGSPVYGVKFSTVKDGFQVGQTVQVNSSKFAVNILVIVKRITAHMYSPTQIRYDVECVGTDTVNFIDIMKVLLTEANSQTNVADSTVLQVLLSLSESITISDAVHTPTTSSPPYKWGTMVWGFFTWS